MNVVDVYVWLHSSSSSIDIFLFKYFRNSQFILLTHNMALPCSIFMFTLSIPITYSFLYLATTIHESIRLVLLILFTVSFSISIYSIPSHHYHILSALLSLCYRLVFSSTHLVKQMHSLPCVQSKREKNRGSKLNGFLP